MAKTLSLRDKLLAVFLSIVLVMGVGGSNLIQSSKSEEAYADNDTMVVYYDFQEIKPSSSSSVRPSTGTNLLFAPTSISTVSSSEAFLGLPSGCGMMTVDGTSSNSYLSTYSITNYTHVKHPSDAQKSINTSVGFDGCNGAFGYVSGDSTYWHYCCDGGGKQNVYFRVYTYKQATVSVDNLTARTTVQKEVSASDIKIAQSELEVTLTVGGKTFKIDSSRWTFVDDTVNYVKNDRQITIQFGNVKASCNVEFYGQDPDPHTYKTVTRDADQSGDLKVGETLHYDVKVTNEATVGSIWKNVTITETIPVGLTLVPGSVNLARTQTIGNTDNLDSIPLSDCKYTYNEATRTISLEIPYYVLNGQAYELTYDVVVDATAVAGGVAGGTNETRDLTSTANVTGQNSSGTTYSCPATACLPITGITDPNAVKVEQVVPGGANDANKDASKTETIDYLETTMVAENVSDTREGAMTQVYDVIKYTLTMENVKPGSVFRDAQLIDELPEGLEIILDDADYPMTITKTSQNESDREWSKSVSSSDYDATTRTLTTDAGDMFGGERVTLTFYAKVTPDAIGEDIENTGAAQASAPTTPGDEAATQEAKGDDVTESTGEVALGNPEPTAQKTIEVIAKKTGEDMANYDKNIPQIGDTVRTTVVISNPKEYTDWVDVVVDDSCSDTLDLIPESIRVFDADGNDVTDECLTLDESTQAIKLVIPSIPGGESYTLQYDAEVNVKALADSSGVTPNITDPVKVSGGTPDPTDTIPAAIEDDPVNLARPGDPLDTVTKTMKVVEGDNLSLPSVGDTVEYTIIAGNLGDATTQALRPIAVDPLPEGVELTSKYVYVTKLDYNSHTKKWSKASPEYVRKILASNVYNKSARTLVVPVGEYLSADADRACVGQTGYEITFECEVTSAVYATQQNMKNVAYTETEKPSVAPMTKSDDDDSASSDDPNSAGNGVGSSTTATDGSRPVYNVDRNGDIVDGNGNVIADPDGLTIKNTDTLADHPSIPDADIDVYIQKQGADPIEVGYPTDEDGDVVQPVVDPETGNPRVEDKDGHPSPVYEKVLDINDNPVKPDQIEVLEDLGIPKATAEHQVVKEIHKLAEDGQTIAGSVTYDSGKTGAQSVVTKDDTTYKAGDMVNALVSVRNLVEGTRWAGAVVIDTPGNLEVTYAALIDPYEGEFPIYKKDDKGKYGRVTADEAETVSTMSMRTMSVKKASAKTMSARTTSSSIANLTFDGSQFKLSASEIIGLQEYGIYYEGYIKDGVESSYLGELINAPESTNPLDDLYGNGPDVPDGIPMGAKLPDVGIIPVLDPDHPIWGGSGTDGSGSGLTAAAKRNAKLYGSLTQTGDEFGTSASTAAVAAMSLALSALGLSVLRLRRRVYIPHGAHVRD